MSFTPRLSKERILERRELSIGREMYKGFLAGLDEKGALSGSEVCGSERVLS